MDLKSPYLDAIQHIPGNTAKEKHESLNKIIQQIIESKKAPGNFVFKNLDGSPVPEILTPLINIEIGKILKKTDDVIAALKSDDAVIVNRALQAEWVFDGSNKPVTNFAYFATYIFPEVSLNTRNTIIKRLSQHLGHKNEYTIAQEFFEGLSNTFDVKQAMPLLSACSENYISELIKDGNMCLPKKLIIRLFSKYPELVIKYLKFTMPNSRQKRVVGEYLNFLPKLIKNHVNDFIEIVKSFPNSLSIKLGNKCAELFLKNKGIETLVEFPMNFLHMMSLKLVSAKLNKEQFKLMLRNLFPKDRKDFSFKKMMEQVKFQPQEIQFPLIAEVFKDLYSSNLVYKLDEVTGEMLLLLSSEERAKVAEKKLETYDGNRYEEPWICYLLIKDSIPQIKEQILKANEMKNRATLIRQLILTCKINNSNEDLLRILKYIVERHRNEDRHFWYSVYAQLLQNFDLELLSADHWEILSEMIQRSYVKDQLKNLYNIAENLLEKAVHFNLLNSIPIEDRMTLLAELKIQGWNSQFNILCNYPNYEKQCLETFIEIIPRKFSEDNSICKDNKLNTIYNLMKGLYIYNERIIGTASKKQKHIKSEELLSVVNYPWLLEKVKNIVLTEEHLRYYGFQDMKNVLHKHERILYDSWFPPKEAIAEVFKQEGINLLKKEPGKILEHWKEYLQSCENNLNNVYTKRFLKKCTWYSEIPIKFLEETLSKLSKGDSKTIMILALLLRGPEFIRVIEPMMPVSGRMEINREDAKKMYRQASSIPPAVNLVNPPPPLEFVGRFYNSGYLSLGLTSLMNVARRVPVNKVIPFAKSLINKPISVKKHGIRLMYHALSTTDLCELFGHLWNTEKHKSIREVIFQKGHNLFMNNPNKDTWILMASLIEDLNTEDVECFEVLKSLSSSPNEYIYNYFEISLRIIEKLENDGLKTKVTNEIRATFIKQLNAQICVYFPEDYCQLLVQKFLFNLEISDEIQWAGRSYAVNTFLLQAKDKLEPRLRYFCNALSMSIKKSWDISHPKNFRFYPMRELYFKIVNDILENSDRKKMEMDNSILKAFIELFSFVLEPVQDPISYLSLFFMIQYREAEFDSSVFGLLIGKHLPEILNIFCPEMIGDIALLLASFIDCRNIHSGLFIQALIETKSNHSSIVAAKILSNRHKYIDDDLYKDIMEKLRKVKHPTVTSILNKHTVTLSLKDTFIN